MGKESLTGLQEDGNATDYSELIVDGGLEIRFGNVEQDSEELARLFTQSSSLPHLSGVTPHRVSEEERQRIEREYFGLPIMAATSEDVKKYYDKNEGLTLIVAEDPHERRKLLGSVTVQTGNVGVLAANVARLVVDENQRGRGIGRELVRRANAFIFGHRFFQETNASIILGVPGHEIAQHTFRSEGYTSLSELSKRCVSWNPDRGLFVERNVLPMVLKRADYMKIVDNREGQNISTKDILVK